MTDPEWITVHMLGNADPSAPDHVKFRYWPRSSSGQSALLWQHVERVPMVKGRHHPNASTATGYSWFVWHAPKTRAPSPLDG